MNINSINLARGIASVAVCILGMYCMKITGGETGVGWAILGVFLIWAV